MGIMYWYLVGVTGVGTYFDLREKNIPVVFLLLSAIGVIPLAVWKANIPILSRAFGLAVGLFFFGVGYITKEAIGKADAALITIIGAGIGFSDLCAVLLLSFGVLVLVALVLITVKHTGRKARIPFYPFVAAGELALAVLVKMG